MGRPFQQVVDQLHPRANSVLLIICFLVFRSSQGSTTRHFKWEVENMYWSPDCVENVVMGINGQFPGPTIRAQVGDTIHLELSNKLLTEGTVIHWHGIRQFGSPWADGTASVSQCAINPGETFIYRFKVRRAGTFFYHGHYGMQRSAGLYGSLIVGVAKGEKEPFHYDGEFNLLLSDWWHKSAPDQEVGLSSRPFRWIGEPQSILINGRGQHNCSLAALFGNNSTNQCNLKGNEQCAPQVLEVQPNKTYRIRLASATALASLNLGIGGIEFSCLYHIPSGNGRVTNASWDFDMSVLLSLSGNLSFAFGSIAKNKWRSPVN